MEETNIIEYGKTYREYKAELDAELTRTAEGYVRIGYLLKIARDTTILRDSGYASVVEFAKAEYGLDKSQVSRFIHINDRFSKDGHSEQLEERYKGFGYAKLALMLQLPDSLNEEITADYTKAEIQAIKEELDEKRKQTDIEVLLEGEDYSTAAMETNLEKTIMQLGQDEPELFVSIFKAARQQDWNENRLQTIMAPSGQKLYSVRIRGIGRKELILKDRENGDEVVLIDLRSGEKSKHTWTELLKVWENLINPEGGADFEDNCKRLWESLYMLEFPIKQEPEEKPEVAPVQPKEKRKESKVVKAKPATAAAVDNTKQPEEQLAGQMNIEQFPEYMPEATYEEITEENDEQYAEQPESKWNEPDLSERAGNAGDALEPGDNETDAGAVQENPDDIWDDINTATAHIRATVAAWGHVTPFKVPMSSLQDAYTDALTVAAGFEKLIMAAGGGEYHG